MDLLKPDLYRADGTASDPNHPALIGGACACGHVFFPLQHHGCEKCGRTDVSPKALSGTGHLIASARVHLHQGKGREAPFTIASVQLDDGPVVRTLLVDTSQPAATGMRVVTTLVPINDSSGAQKLDLRFVAENRP